ncbi:beta-N-acetylhexosaminidase [Prauserella shujinwangii]|uniref:beta-N-acetylhexosaminidase n=1 Tax=Prauserella shujinwangii TaxID=1453103 RepID=A0A2T0LPY0_9PSEU|nr:glycoside hydrolase family 3 N-terminal domain-containing protein [Prauserella shujinwangii]PRX45360.1 beta-N-acetylhexosaminidase [Prauserella shujinwangii]
MKRLLLPFTLAVLLAACGTTGETDGQAGPAPTPAPTTAQSVRPSPSTTESAPAAPTTPTTRRGPDCAPVVAELAPRERLAQLLAVGVEPSDPAAAAALVRREQIGEIFIGGNATELLTGNALARVQRAAKVPVSVAVDDEGGRVQRLDMLDGSLPSAREMARTMSPAEVRDLAERRGQALRARGVTVDYAPILDLTDGPANGVIGDRSYSSDPAVAQRYAFAFAEGLAAAGVRPVFKHFPGHGRASGDSHATVVTTPPLARLRTHDLVPYEDVAGFEGAGVMVGHLDVPGLTDGEPSSLSPATYRLLREDYGFPGLVITDDLGAMRAVSDRYSLPEAVLLALRAGADQALWSSGGDPGPVLDRLERAVTAGELPEERVRESLERVLLAKGACA